MELKNTKIWCKTTEELQYALSILQEHDVRWRSGTKALESEVALIAPLGLIFTEQGGRVSITLEENEDSFLEEDTDCPVLSMQEFLSIFKEGDTAEIRIRYLSDDIEKLHPIGGAKSDWIDLRAAEDVSMKAGEFKLIPLGIAMQLPAGYEAHIVPRSSTFKNFGIIQTNHMGVVDSYCGDNDQWFMPAYALRDTEIHVNDRICQFRIEKVQPAIRFIETDRLGNADRGGAGSTGKN